jgi:hypothetical protein
MSSYLYKGIDAPQINASFTINQSVFDLYINETIPLDTLYTSDFNPNIVHETISQTNYKIKGTDISQFCIANWVESSTSNFSGTTLPSWCTKIRAVLIGGGAGGNVGGSLADYNPTIDYTFDVTYSHNTVNHQHSHVGFGYGNNYDVQHQPQQNSHPHVHNVHYHNTAYGKGGGGGAFIYLPTFVVTAQSRGNVQIQVGRGGGSGQAGGSTVMSLQYQTGTITCTANGGNVDNGGTVQITTQNTSLPSIDDNPNPKINRSQGIISAVGENAQAINGGRNGGTIASYIDSASTVNYYGIGGFGTTGGQGVPAPPAGSGTNGYYRIYYMSS